MDIPYISTKAFGARHGVGPSMARQWAARGLIPGAIQVSGSWLIPTGSARPARYGKPNPAPEPAEPAG